MAQKRGIFSEEKEEIICRMVSTENVEIEQQAEPTASSYGALSSKLLTNNEKGVQRELSISRDNEAVVDEDNNNNDRILQQTKRTRQEYWKYVWDEVR